MGMIEIASGNSVWRGMDYYNNKKVISWEKIGDEEYKGIVSGSEATPYSVLINKAHPRKSTCSCPFADGRRVVCKHMIALFFTVEPKAADEFLLKVKEWEEEEEAIEQQRMEELKEYVMSLSKAELQLQLLDALIELEESRNY